MPRLSDYSKEISKTRQSINYSLLENDSRGVQRLNKSSNGLKTKIKTSSLDTKNVYESFAVLSNLEDPAELDLVMEGPKDKYKKQILGLMETELKKNKTSKIVRQDRNCAAKSIGMDSSLKLGMEAYSYSEGAEWSPMNPSLMWRKKKEKDNATTISSSFSNQRALMNSPGIIRELENELGPVKGSIKLASTGEKFHDINIGIPIAAKEVWRDEPLSQITKIAPQDRDKPNSGYYSQWETIYDNIGVKPAELVKMSDFGNIKLPVRSVLSMSQEASMQVEKKLLEKEGALEVNLLNLVDPQSQKLNHNDMPENKMYCDRRPVSKSCARKNLTTEKQKILFGDDVDKEMQERHKKDLMRLRTYNINFEKHLGFKLTGKVCLDNIEDKVVSLETNNNSKLIGREFRELRHQLGWEVDGEDVSKGKEKEFNIYGNLLDQKNKSNEAVVNRLIENTTLYPCFDEVLFENTFRIHPDKNRNRVSLITDHLDATSVLNSGDLLLNIHKRQYTPPLAENFPKGLPSVVQDPRIIWQREFLNIPYEITADLIKKIQRGFWDEIANDIVKSSYGSISVSSVESISNIKKFILNELNYSSMYNVDEPFDVSPPKLAPIERDTQQRVGTNFKPQLINNNNKLILTPKLKLGFGSNSLISSPLSRAKDRMSGEMVGKLSSRSDEKQSSEQKRLDVSTINCIPECELYETALWNRYEFPNDNSNKGVIRKVKGLEIVEGDPLYKDNVIAKSNEWRADMEKQTRERKEGVDMLVNSQGQKYSHQDLISKLNSIVESRIEDMSKKELAKLSEVLKEQEPSEPVKTRPSAKEEVVTETSKLQKDNWQLNISGLKNLGVTNFTNNLQGGIHTNFDSIDFNKSGVQQNYLFKKIRNSQKTGKNKAGFDVVNDEYDDDDSSIRDDDSEEFEDLSSENDEDYRQICETIQVEPWEPTNLMFTKTLFKSTNIVFSTLSIIIAKDSKFRNRIELHELGEHGLIIWLSRETVGLKEKVMSCCSKEKGRLRIKGGIYFTPETEISPIEPCTEIPGNFSFTITGVSLSQLVLNRNSPKQLDYVKKYVANYERSIIQHSSYSNISSFNENETYHQNSNARFANMARSLKNENNPVDDSPIMEQTQFGVNVDTDIDIITRYDRKTINNIDVMSLIPALRNSPISGHNTILVVTENPLLRGILPISLSGLPRITMRFSLRRNRLLLWRSIRCQIWKAQYIDYCFKSSIVPAKKLISFISNAFSKSSSFNSFDMGGLLFQENLFSHCINVALSRKEPKEMIFRGCYMGDEGFLSIFPLLSQLKSLGKLDLGMNNLTARSLPLILEVVKNCNCKKLLLDFNNLGPNKTKREFSMFFKQILLSTNIEYLNLSRNKINGRCIDSLDTMLDNSATKNRTLETLCWCSNGNTLPEIETLLIALQPCCANLSRVLLGGNPIERVDAFKRRFNPIKIIMEDVSLQYVNRSGEGQEARDNFRSSNSRRKSTGLRRKTLSSNYSMNFSNSGLFTQ
ncbi:leucine rich repeat-containing protein with coiled coil [Cryptosporidium canis]|nr:leucine rich repeat-containing protein with coiled coil [Cryptosporidium canis]